jgi:fatty acid-binding protein DegV
MGFIGHALGNALDMKPIARCFRGETGPVAKVRHFAAAAERVFANVTREIERGLLVPFVNLSYGGDRAAIAHLRGFATLAQAASKHGVEVCWSHLSMVAGINIGPGALSVGIVAQPHTFT